MRRVLLVVIGGMLLNLAGVANGFSAEDHAKEEAAALKVAAGWLAIVDAGNYGKSWDEAAVYFKNAMPREQWRQSLNAARKPLGKLVRRTVLIKKYYTKLPGAPAGEYVVIQYKTAFEHRQITVETVTPMKDEDGKWRVSGYYIK